MSEKFPLTLLLCLIAGVVFNGGLLILSEKNTPSCSNLSEKNTPSCSKVNGASMQVAAGKLLGLSEVDSKTVCAWDGPGIGWKEFAPQAPEQQPQSEAPTATSTK